MSMTVDISPVGDGLKVNAAAVGFTVNAECQSARLEVRHKVDGIMPEAEPEPIPVVTYTVTTNLENVTSDAPSTVEEGSPLVVTLTGTGDNRVQANSVVVTMGGVDITSSAYNHSTKTVSIASVTGFVGITAVGRPYDAEVEWLESDGNQYIDTGVGRYTNQVKLVMDIQFTDLSGRQIIGAADAFYIGVNASRWECDYQKYIGTADTLRHIYSEEITNKTSKVVKLDNTTIHTSTVASYNYAIRNTIGFFAISSTASVNAIAKMYSSQIVIDNNLVRDYIPVRKDGVGYLYDKVSGVLFGNDRSGAFTYGNDKT